MIINNEYIPFKGYKAMAIWPFIFVRGDKSMSAKTLNHERIHFRQQIEMLLLFFYLLYLVFWLVYGYRRNPFEQEAFSNADDFMYLNNRKPFAWTKFVSKRKDYDSK